MRHLATDDEKRLDSVDWLHGSFLRGVQVDVERKDLAVYVVTSEHLVELLCEDVRYAVVPNLFDWTEPPRVVGLVVQPLEDVFVVRLEFSNHPAEIHLHCQRVVVRKELLPARAP
jgi:hypothetical protein